MRFERQGCDRQVDAGHPQGRDAHEGTDEGGEHHRDRCRQRERYAVAEEHRVAVGADGKECRVSEAHEPGIADQQHESDPCYGPDEDQDEFAHVERAQEQGCRDHCHGQQGVPEPLPVVAEQVDVLAVVGGEHESHEGPTPSSVAWRRRCPAGAPGASRAGSRRR